MYPAEGLSQYNPCKLPVSKDNSLLPMFYSSAHCTSAVPNSRFFTVEGRFSDLLSYVDATSSLMCNWFLLLRGMPIYTYTATAKYHAISCCKKSMPFIT